MTIIRAWRRPLQGRGGFGNHVEFMIIIAMIGILAAIAIPHIAGYINPEAAAKAQPLSDALTFDYFSTEVWYGYPANLALAIMVLIFWFFAGLMALVVSIAILEGVWELVSHIIRSQTATITEKPKRGVVSKIYRNFNSQSLQLRVKFDRSRVEHIVERAYQEAGHPPPEKVIWLSSPFAGMVAAALLAEGKVGGDLLNRPIKKRLVRRAGFAAWRHVTPDVESHFYSDKWPAFNSPASINTLRHMITVQLEEDAAYKEGQRLLRVARKVAAELEEQSGGIFSSNDMRHLDRTNVIQAADDMIIDACQGAFDADDLAYYKGLQEAFDPEWLTPLRPLFDLCRFTGWWWPFEKVAIVTEKPVAFRKGAGGVLDGLGDEPAIEFADGWCVHMSRSVLVPKEWGETPLEQWDPRWILKTDNQEVRRRVMEICGYSRVLAAFNSTLIHQQDDMELRHIEGVDIETVALLKVTCPSTGAFYALRVPPNIFDCEEARLWTFGDEKLEFLRET